MAYTKRIVCLANSMKVGGNCIAGREVLPNGRYGGWIRPISSRPTAEISFMESLCEGNLDPELLDILEIPLGEARPHNHQTENHLIDPSHPWIKQGRIPQHDLFRLCQHPTALWLNSDKTIHGSYDCLSQRDAVIFTKSLVFIQVKSLTVEVRARTRDGYTRPTFRASFKYNGIYYNLSITDPHAVHAFGRRGNGAYAVPGAYLTVSLTEPYAKDNNRSHKIIAAILPERPF